MRRSESRAMKQRIAKAILSNDNQLTSQQLQMRFPRAVASMISAVAKSLGLRLPHSEFLGEPDMEPFVEDKDDVIERIKMTYWRRGNNEHRDDWAERWREREG